MPVTFDAVWRHAYAEQLRALLPGRCAEDLDILPLHETLAALGYAGEIDVGRCDVPVEAIVGTVSRVSDFDLDSLDADLLA